MKVLYDTKIEAPRAFLVILDAKDEGSTAEIKGLADTLGLHIVGSELIAVREQKSRYSMGSGKARELAEKAIAAEAQCIIFDSELSPSQQRNWEALSGLSVLDRQELIINIFASRARTREAELQTRLAELLFALPRLSHKYIDLSRQRGGRYGTRGAGETRLETDKRQIRQKIGVLQKEIEEIRKNRTIQHKQRKKQGISVCALVGYTNAGKSSLHRALTGSDVLVEDKLFATLDPTARKAYRVSSAGKGKNLIFVDTVGFIRRLPHNLVDAFRATLEELAQAELLIHVLDASEPDWIGRTRTVLGLVEELKAQEIPLITVLNKKDLLTGDELSSVASAFEGEFPALASSITAVSSKNREGLEDLWKLIENALKF